MPKAPHHSHWNPGLPVDKDFTEQKNIGCVEYDESNLYAIYLNAYVFDTKSDVKTVFSILYFIFSPRRKQAHVEASCESPRGKTVLRPGSLRNRIWRIWNFSQSFRRFYKIIIRVDC